MLNKIIAKLLNKKLYKSSITILADDFTATYNNDSLLESLKWTLHGMYEANHTQSPESLKSKSTTNGIFGQICKFKIISFTSGSITILDYAKSKNEDMMFMSNSMVYIPDTILKTLKKDQVSLEQLDSIIR